MLGQLLRRTPLTGTFGRRSENRMPPEPPVILNGSEPHLPVEQRLLF